MTPRYCSQLPGCRRISNTEFEHDHKCIVYLDGRRLVTPRYCSQLPGCRPISNTEFEHDCECIVYLDAVRTMQLSSSEDTLVKPRPKKSPPAKTKRPQCVVCGVALPRFKGLETDEATAKCLTADGGAAQWGGHGDNLVCTNACGRLLAVRIVASVPGVLDLLPPELRADLRPPPGVTEHEQLLAPHVKARRIAERTKL